MRLIQRLSHPLVVTSARWFLGIVFLASALGKITDPAGFAENVAAFRIVPFAAVNVFAIVMTWTEFLVGLSLLNGVKYKSGALLVVVMNAVFIVAIASAMVRGLSVECGCFTMAKSTVGWSLIARDVVLIAIASLLLLPPRAEDAGRPKTTRERVPRLPSAS
jgi:uncharacterized membrane protein YphA (DoxX/SURF4 family)